MNPSRRDAYGPPRPYRSGARGRAGVPRSGGPPPDLPLLPGTGDYDFDLDRALPPPRQQRSLPGRPSLLEPAGDLEPLPPARPKRNYHGRRRQENPWASYGLIVAVPLVLVLLIVAFSALPPYTPNSRAQQQPNAAAATNGRSTGAAPATSPAATGGGATTAAVYEAEDTTHNTLGPTTKLRAVTGASGGMVVTNIGRGTPAGDVKFNNVTANAAGKYSMTIYYMLGDTVAHRLALWVNGKGPTILSFNPSGGNTIATYKATVTLAAGTNNIRFSNATQKYGPDLDRITLAAQQ